MSYQLIIFDLDGTLADTSEGIINSYLHVVRKYKLKDLSAERIRSFIGQNLLRSFINNYSIDESFAREVVDEYRDRYAKKGVYESEPYPGLVETLRYLKDGGIQLGVATLKKTDLAETVLEHCGVKSLFDVIHGMDANDSRTKESLIQSCLDDLGISRQEAVMVGDSLGDLNAAKAKSVDFIAVSFGFGFTEQTVFDDAVVRVCGSFGELGDYLLQKRY